MKQREKPEGVNEMITAVTLNPCIDSTLYLNRLIPGGHNVVHRSVRNVSGKGINVNLALRGLGAETAAFGFAFCAGGNETAQLLREQGIPYDYVEVPQPLRVNLKLFDEEKGEMTEVNSPGSPVSAAELENLTALLPRVLDETDVLVMSGSVPPNVPDGVYGEMIAAARRRGIRTILDTSGARLRAGIKAGPDLVKPNREELEGLLGREIRNMEDARDACREAITLGAGSVCLTLGPEGAMLVTKDRAFFSPPLPVKPRSFQGAGDAVTAGIALEMERGEGEAEWLRSGCAAAQATIQLEGTQMCGFADYAAMRARVEIRTL